MQLCRGQQQQETQCCFFDESTHRERDSHRPSKQAYSSGLKHRSMGNNNNGDNKNIQVLPKQTRLISKNHRKQKSQEKGKLSLSKLSNRKASNSREHCQPKQNIHNIHNNRGVIIHSSAPKSSSVVQYSTHTHNNATVIGQRIQEATNINVVNPMVGSNNNQRGRYQNSMMQFRPESPHYYNNENRVIKLSNNAINQVNFKPHYHTNQHYQQHPQFFSSQMQAFEQPGFGNHNARVMNLRAHTKPQSYNISINANPSNPNTNIKVNVPNMSSSIHDETMKITINNTNNTIYGIDHSISEKTAMPTLSTQRMMEKSTHHPPKLNLSQHKSSRVVEQNHNPSQDRQFSQSRYTEGLSPQLDLPHLKTVYSVYSQDMQHRTELRESIVVVDFFNPSESMRREIEEKISNRYTANHNNFLF